MWKVALEVLTIYYAIEELAEKLGVTRATISRWRHGHNQPQQKCCRMLVSIARSEYPEAYNAAMKERGAK